MKSQPKAILMSIFLHFYFFEAATAAGREKHRKVKFKLKIWRMQITYRLLDNTTDFFNRPVV